MKIINEREGSEMGMGRWRRRVEGLRNLGPVKSWDIYWERHIHRKQRRKRQRLFSCQCLQTLLTGDRFSQLDTSVSPSSSCLSLSLSLSYTLMQIITFHLYLLLPLHARAKQNPSSFTWMSQTSQLFTSSFYFFCFF